MEHRLWVHRSRAKYSYLKSYFSLQSTLKLFKFILRIFDFRQDISQTCRPAMSDRTTSSPQGTFYSLPPRRQQRPYGASLQEQLEARWPRTFLLKTTTFIQTSDRPAVLKRRRRRRRRQPCERTTCLIFQLPLCPSRDNDLSNEV